MTVAVVIVNYNNAQLALRAASSVLGDDPTAKVVIVDNASTDESAALLTAAIAGAALPGDHCPPQEVVLKPSFEIVRSDAPAENQRSADVIVAFAESNGGFASGCNIGLRIAEKTFRPEVFLLLNPDAMLARGAISAFRHRLAEPAIGLCGATVLRSTPPHPVQSFCGAALHPVTLLGSNIGEGRRLTEAPAAVDVETRVDYPLGAAIACRRDYIERVGVLDDRFFLFYEEADWARRGRPHYRIGWAADAIAYHDHGASAGSRLAAGGRSALADYHMARSRLLFALKWRPWLAPALMILVFMQAARRLGRGRLPQALAVLAGGMPGGARLFRPLTH